MNPIRWIAVRLIAIGLTLRHLRNDLIVVGRIGRGRLYVMRDMPDEYVRFYACWPTELEPGSPVAARMVKEARQEASLRLQRDLRELEDHLRTADAPEQLLAAVADLRETVRAGQ